MDERELARIKIDASDSIMWLSPNGATLAVVVGVDDEDDAFLHIIDTGSHSIVNSIALDADLHDESSIDEESIIEVAWSIDNSSVAIATRDAFPDDTVVVRILDHPDYQVRWESLVEVPNTDGYGWSDFTGIRWADNGARIAVDFHGVNSPPEHWPFAVVILDAISGEVTHTLGFIPGQELVLNSTLTALYYLQRDVEGFGRTELQIFDLEDATPAGIPINEIVLADWDPDRDACPVLSKDETELYLPAKNENTMMVFKLDDPRVAQLMNIKDYEEPPIMSWSRSGNHCGNTQVTNTDGSRTYRFDELASEIVVTGTASEPQRNGAPNVASKRHILLELPTHPRS